jgi:hypothetical protein
VKRAFLAVFGVAVLASGAARAVEPLPAGGRNVFVKYDTTKCLVALGPAEENVGFPGSQPMDLPMDRALEVIPGTDTSGKGIWVGIVDCAAWSLNYEVGSLAYYNERMAVWWRPDTEGRLRSWVQPYACLDAPGGTQPPTDSYWLYLCSAGKTVDANFFTYSAEINTLTSHYSSISESAPQCLVPDVIAQPWTDRDNRTFQVQALKLGACTEAVAKKWTVEEMAWQTYPYPSDLSNPTEAPFDVLICPGNREDCAIAGAPWERSAVYHVNTQNTPEGNFSSSFTPFSMSTGGFPVSVKVYYKWSNSPAVDPTASNSYSVMALDQSIITAVTGYARVENISPYVEFEVSAPGYVTVVFTGALETSQQMKPRLALFIDPLGTPFADLSGCTRTTACDPRAIDGREGVKPFFVGPGLYEDAGGESTCSFLADLSGHLGGSELNVHVAGGAHIKCPLSASYPAGTKPSRVTVSGRGVFDGRASSTPTEPGPILQEPELDAVPPALVKACAADISIEGITLMNTQPRGRGSLAANSPWDCGQTNLDFYINANSVLLDHVKQVAGHSVTADGFDVGSNSTITDSFIEANDDSIKMIANNQHFDRMTIWQNPIGWAIECGWGQTPDHSNVSVQNVDIHLIDHPYDKYCCSDKDEDVTCTSQNESTQCAGTTGNDYPPGAAACDDALGKQAVIGCLNGVKNKSYSNFSIKNIWIRNPRIPSADVMTAGTPYNRIQRIFAIGVTTAPYSAPQCPDHVTLTNFELENVFSITPAPEVSSSRSRLYVNATPDSSIGGSHPAEAFKVNAVYTDCANPVPQQSLALNACSPKPLALCPPEEGETNCFQVNGRHPDQVNVLVPEPDSAIGAVAGLFAVFAARCFRRRHR